MIRAPCEKYGTYDNELGACMNSSESCMMMNMVLCSNS